MANIGILLQRMSDYLDKGRPDVKVITVKCRRQTAQRFARAKWWGGPLEFNGREVITMDPAPRPYPPTKVRKSKAHTPTSCPDVSFPEKT
jgi:hypothetical protein